MAIVVNAGLHSTYSDGAEVQNRYRLVLELEPYASPLSGCHLNIYLLAHLATDSAVSMFSCLAGSLHRTKQKHNWGEFDQQMGAVSRCNCSGLLQLKLIQ